MKKLFLLLALAISVNVFADVADSEELSLPECEKSFSGGRIDSKSNLSGIDVKEVNSNTNEG